MFTNLSNRHRAGTALLLPLLFMGTFAYAQSATTQSAELSELGNIRGIVKPRDEAVLSSEIFARIKKLKFKDGQRFNKGDTLVNFDCSLYHAELQSAKAEHEARSKTLDNNVELAGLNAIGALEVEVARAEVKKAKADVQIASVNVSRCRIHAPYSGRVVETKVNAHESVSPNDELMAILDDSRLEIEVIVPSRWLTWLEQGTGFSFLIDETGAEYPARITEIGAAVDSVSQTVRVTGTFDAALQGVLAGMSGTARFTPPES